MENRTPKTPPKYLQLNKDLWDQWAELHVDSSFYDQASFEQKLDSLQSIEKALLGPLAGKKVLHLQCHFGQDSLSLAAMGAEVTAVDFSSSAIAIAQKINDKLGMQVHFIQANVLELDQHLDEQYDLVFASYGVLGWHPDLHPWYEQAAKRLNPNGRLVVVEFHPFIWMLDDAHQHDIVFPYFNRMIFDEIRDNSYATAPGAHNELQCISWNHSIADSMQALLEANLKITDFQEYDYSPYDIFVESISCSGGYQNKSLPGLIPLVFSLVAQANSV